MVAVQQWQRQHCTTKRPGSDCQRNPCRTFCREHQLNAFQSNRPNDLRDEVKPAQPGKEGMHTSAVVVQLWLRLLRKLKKLNGLLSRRQKKSSSGAAAGYVEGRAKVANAALRCQQRPPLSSKPIMQQKRAAQNTEYAPPWYVSSRSYLDLWSVTLLMPSWRT